MKLDIRIISEELRVNSEELGADRTGNEILLWIKLLVKRGENYGL